MKKILLVSSEAEPYVKTGGLGEAVGSLAKYRDIENSDIRIVIPKYGCMNTQVLSELQFLCHFYVDLNWRRQYVGVFKAEKNGITYYFIDNEFYFAKDTLYGSMQEDVEKFAYFSKAVLASLPYIDFCPDIIHCHDWQTGLVPVFLKTVYGQDPYYCDMKTVFTIYDMQFQGRWGIPEIMDITGLPYQMFTEDKLGNCGDANYLKGGSVYADAVAKIEQEVTIEREHDSIENAWEADIKEAIRIDYDSSISSGQYEQIYAKLLEV